MQYPGESCAGIDAVDREIPETHLARGTQSPSTIFCNLMVHFWD